MPHMVPALLPAQRMSLAAILGPNYFNGSALVVTDHSRSQRNPGNIVGRYDNTSVCRFCGLDGLIDVRASEKGPSVSRIFNLFWSRKVQELAEYNNVRS